MTVSIDFAGGIRNRILVILVPAKDYYLWLNPEVQEVELLDPPLRPYAAEETMIFPVSTQGNIPAKIQRGAWDLSGSGCTSVPTFKQEYLDVADR